MRFTRPSWRPQTNIERNNDGLPPIKTEKDIIDIYKLWYDSYYDIIKLIQIVGISILGFTITSIILKQRDTPSFADINTIRSLSVPIFIIIGSVVSSFACMLTTYGWFITLLEHARNSKLDEDRIKPKELTDINYRKYMGGMKFWGILSLLTGWLAGLLLFVGLIMYTIRFLFAFT